MHIPDGFLDPKTSVSLIGVAASTLSYCFVKVLRTFKVLVSKQVLAGNENIEIGESSLLNEFGEKKAYQMAIVAAWIFAVQIFNFPIQEGTSAHILGGVFAALVLGPFAGAIVMAFVIFLQAVLFADGGIMALGANLINMAIIGCFVSFYIYKVLKKICSELISTAIAAWFSVVLAALACSLEIAFSGTIGINFVVPPMLKTYCLVGIFEAAITVILLKLFNTKNGN